jgi:hypothetical protein
MDPFSYLSVLISIILALSIAHLLSALVRVIHNRSRVVLYWPTLSYVFILFVVIVQVWWFDFYLSRHINWTFPAFASTLLIPADLYLLCALLLPSADLPSDDNMRTAYYRNRVWFFGALFAIPVLGFTQELLVDGHIGATADTALRLVFEAVILVAVFVKAERVQKVLAVVGVVLIVIYVMALFPRLA